MFDFDDYYNDAQVYEPSFSNPYEDPWESASLGTVDFLGPAEESQFEGFDSTLTGDDYTTGFDSGSSWSNNIF
jgi:hypothetical protein